VRRREFIAGLGGAAAWPLVARAQPAAMPVVGYLHSSTVGQTPSEIATFLHGLGDAGFVEGQTVVIAYRNAEDRVALLPELAADLVRRRVAVIVTASSSPAALAAKAATQTIPVVFVIGADPVELGVVASLARPGANVTGVTTLDAELVGKRLGLLRELLPAATTIAFLVNLTNQSDTESVMRGHVEETKSLGLRILILNATNPSEIEPAFEALSHQHADAIIVLADAFFQAQQDQLVALAARYAVPVSYFRRSAVEAGGLISYEGDPLDAHRIVGGYVGRILKGEKPADLPVQQSAKVNLVINLKTAKALGLTVPETLLARADEVIE
jgi:putative tryptophan/tyrosine transport system substrate-binding protein